MDLEEKVNECEKNILNLLQDCWEGMCRKETTMAMEGSWKGGINFHPKWIPYLDSTGPENQKRLAGPQI